jgi:hypothetical protein
MRALLSTIGTLASLVGAASAQNRESFESISIPCSSAPTDSRTELPAQLALWAMFSCTRFGHVISAAKGWVWHNPRTNRFVRIWSQPSDGNLQESGHENYFKTLEFRQLSPQEAESANAALAVELGAKAQQVADAYTLVVIDASGRTQTTNFVRAEANVRHGTFWGWSCASPCSKPEVFMGFRP